MEIKKTLTIPIGESDEKVTVYVLDIINSEKFNKNFIFYLIDLDKDNVYASQLDKVGDMYELNSITDEEELKFVTEEINKYKEN